MTKTPDVPNKLDSNLGSRSILNFEIVSDFDIRISNLGNTLLILRDDVSESMLFRMGDRQRPAANSQLVGKSGGFIV